MVAEAGVNPADQRWLGGLCCHLRMSMCSGFEGLVPELSLNFCATGRDCGPVLLMRSGRNRSEQPVI